MVDRMLQVNENLQRELSRLLVTTLTETDLFLTVTDVSVSHDLKTATVLISLLKSDQGQAVAELLNKRSHQFYRPLAERLKMKYVPQLTFRFDDHQGSVEKIESLLDQISRD